MRRAVEFALFVGLAVAARAAAPAPKSIAASRVATGRALVEYVTGHDALDVGRIDGLDLATAKGLEITIRSEFPTQLRLYLVGGGAPPRFRLLVFSRSLLEQKLALPLDGFDPDPGAAYPASGPMALILRDCPGMLRPKLANRLAVGPLRPLAQAPPVAPDEVPPGPEAEADPEFRRVLGGWLGKIAGGAAGMPMEGSLVRDPALADRVALGLPAGTWGFGPDDDSSFVALHLLVARETGPSLATPDLLRAWVRRFAPEFLWKTERYALDAIEHGVAPPATGEGPLGESLCARIRADLWGFLCPSDPARTLTYVARDAPISNCREGLRAAEFAAVAVSLAFRGGSVEDLLAATLAAQPVAGSEHSAVVRACWDDYKAGKSIGAAYARLKRETFDPISQRDAHNAWVYALPNAGAVTLALLYGGGDFARTMGLAASLGWDTDCNAATAGCILGVLQTDATIPAAFRDPLHDRIRVAIAGREHWSLRRLAAETCRARAQFAPKAK